MDDVMTQKTRIPQQTAADIMRHLCKELTGSKRLWRTMEEDESAVVVVRNIIRDNSC